MNSSKTVIAIALVTGVILDLNGCVFRDRHYKSSIVDYLYPDKQGIIEQAEVPLLALPLRVGVAFVPEGIRNRGVLTERDKMELMKKMIHS